MKKITFLTLLLSTMALMMGCKGENGTAARERMDYEREVQAKLSQIDSQINDLKAKADSAATDVQQDVNQKLNQLETQKNDLQKKLSELKTASRTQYQELKGEMDKRLTDIHKSLSQIADEIHHKQYSSKQQ